LIITRLASVAEEQPSHAVVLIFLELHSPGTRFPIEENLSLAGFLILHLVPSKQKKKD
jgi:hypothetical protein